MGVKNGSGYNCSLFPEPRLRLQTERVGSDSGGRKLLDSFSEKTDVGKYAIQTHFPVVKMLEPNSQSKHTANSHRD